MMATLSRALRSAMKCLEHVSQYLVEESEKIEAELSSLRHELSTANAEVNPLRQKASRVDLMEQELKQTHEACEMNARIAAYPNGGYPLVAPQCPVDAECQVRKLMEVEK